MIWVILYIVATIGAIIWIWCENLWYGVDCCILESVAAIFIAFVIFAIIIVASSAIVSSGENAIEYKKVSDIPITALKDNLNVNGNFYLMSGYINEDLYYYYVTETELGYKTEKIEADNAFIKYVNEEPYIEKYEGEFTKSINYIWGFPVCDDRYIIYCPEGTVTNEFKVNLE